MSGGERGVGRGHRKQDSHSSFTVARPLYLLTDGTSHSKCVSKGQVERPEDAPIIETRLNCGGGGDVWELEAHGVFPKPTQ